MMQIKHKKELIFALALLVLLIIPVARQVLYDGLPVGEQAYNDLISAQNPSNLYYWLLSLVDDTAILPYIFPILGLASLIIFYSLIKDFEQKKKLLIALLLISSPAFIYTFSTINIHAFSVFLLLVAIKLLVKDEKLNFFALLILLIVAAFTLFDALLVLTILFVCFKLRKTKESFIALIASFFMILAYYLFFSSEKVVVYTGNIFRQTFSGMGAINGYSAFFVFLAIIGFLALWKKKTATYFVLLYLLVSLFFFENIANSYLVFVLAIFAGESFALILKRRWKVKLIKNLSILIIIAGILFATALYYSRFVSDEPNKEIVKSLEAIGEYPEGVVLSHCSNSYWINYFSDKKAFIGDCSERQKIIIAETIFYATDLDVAYAALKENNISNIWIDPEMMQGQVWSTPKQGLLFLFRNNKTFKNIYSGSGTETWQVLEK